MSEHAGLRERKKMRTHRAISDAAIALFLERGFDRVSVADVAAAAEVSKPTLFKYFAAKEDLVLHRITDHRGEFARVVRAAPGEPPLDALHRHFVDGLDRRDPVTGLNAAPEVLAFHGMVFTTPSLQARLSRYAESERESLADALAEHPTALAEARRPPAGRSPAPGGDLTARLAAAQIIAVTHVLARDNWRRLTDGQDAGSAHPGAVADADHAFALLATGLTPHPSGDDVTARCTVTRQEDGGSST
ncbi:TetR/AcrR family transcriptional regulator [Actinomadura roseirufa]|uniref:TetR/AcrR family transcriptional regulator n=1 Tax=Actinomadura roseirufa TaxID=2094049 RepID=UPI0010415B1C|nr:TetR/AcrR family transcriptional regulator [Actinomadura roseirufa]